MSKRVLAITCVCLLSLGMGTSVAGTYEGVVLETTVETIKIEQWGKTYTLLMSNELQTNTETASPFSFYVKLKDVKKGDKVAVECYIQDGALIFTGIRPCPPTDAGIVTEVGKDTLTIRNNKGETKTYRVKKELAENSQDHYSPLYPSRFSEATLGSRVEIIAFKEDGEMIIWALDVKKEKVNDK